jgi:hypothetical protein
LRRLQDRTGLTKPVTNDETILREVDQALAEDQTSTVFRRNLPLIIGAAVAVVAGVAGWQFYSAKQAAAAQEASKAYEEAIKAVQSGGEAGRAPLEKLAAGKGGYAVMAKMRLAGAFAADGDRAKALELYRAVYASSHSSKRIKDLARLRAAYLSISDGRDAVIADVGPLETDMSVLGHYAREILGVAALGAGDYQSAETLFLKSAASLDAPEPLKVRAKEYAALAAAGKAGVKFPVFADSGKSQVEEMMEQLEAAEADLGDVLDSGGATPAPATEGESHEGRNDAAEAPVNPGNE